FEERHGNVSIAMVLAGTFQYRGSACDRSANGGSAKRGSVKRGSVKRGSANGGSAKRGSVKRGSVKSGSANGAIRNELMTPGSLLLGNAGQSFEVGHEHAAGDRCLSLQFTPEYFERIASDAGVKKSDRGFRLLRLPPLRELSSLIARARAGLEYSAD